ncbi:hypothetical protein [Persephonella sp.]
MEAVLEYLAVEGEMKRWLWLTFLLSLGTFLAYWAGKTFDVFSAINQVFVSALFIGFLISAAYSLHKVATLREMFPSPKRIFICCKNYDENLNTCLEYSEAPKITSILVKAEELSIPYRKISCLAYVLNNRKLDSIEVDCKVLRGNLLKVILPVKNLLDKYDYETLELGLTAELSNFRGHRREIFLNEVEIGKVDIPELCQENWSGKERKKKEE